MPLSTTRTAADSQAAHLADHNAMADAYNVGAFGFKNAIINSAFDVWQRGVSFSAIGYTADRWMVNFVGSSVVTTQQALALGTTIGPFQPKFFFRSVVTSVAAAGNYAMLIQRIEGVRAFASRQVAISFWAKADAAKNIALEFEQIFGGGGTPSANVTTQLGLVALTTAWVRYTVIATVPSIAGKTIGTDGADSLALNFFFDINASFAPRGSSLGQQSGTFDIWGVQVEAGAYATSYEYRPIAVELPLCQRYFYRNDLAASSNNARAGYAVAQSSTSSVAAIPLPVLMRALPTFSSSTVANFIIYDGNTTYPLTSLGNDTTDFRNPTLTAVTAARTGGAYGQFLQLCRNAGSTPCYLDFSAEL